MKYNKLVRDNIPQIIRSTGKKVSYRILDETEYIEYLEKKLDEEIAEFRESRSVEELADILEVIDALCEARGDTAYVRFLKNQKAYEKGGFKERICLLEVDDGTSGLPACKCGAAPEYIKIYSKNRPDCFIRCQKCGLETKIYKNRQNARYAWARLIK